jgi:hypothetical protein
MSKFPSRTSDSNTKRCYPLTLVLVLLVSLLAFPSAVAAEPEGNGLDVEVSDTDSEDNPQTTDAPTAGPAGVDGDFQPHNGCKLNETPNIFGSVTNGAQPYAGSTVSALLKFGNYSAGWGLWPTGREAVTDANGQFSMCLDLGDDGSGDPWMVQFVAASKDRGPAATLGDSASGLFDLYLTNPTACSWCENIEIEMSTPTFRGRIPMGQSGILTFDNASTLNVDQVARLALDGDGSFATSYPLGSADVHLYKYQIATDEYSTIPLLAPLSGKLDAVAVEGGVRTLVSAGLPDATLRVEFIGPSGESLADTGSAWASLNRFDDGECRENLGFLDRYLNGCEVRLNAVRFGFAAAPPDGSYVLEVWGYTENQSIQSSATFSFSNGQLQNPSDNLTFTDGRWLLRFEGPRILLTSSDLLGVSVSSGTSFYLEKLNPQNGWFEGTTNASPLGEGTWGWTPPASGADGIYRVRVEGPPARPELGYTTRWFKISGSGGSAFVTDTCLIPIRPDETPICTPITGGPSTELDISFEPANLRLQVCRAVVDGQCEGFNPDNGMFPDVELHRLIREEHQDGMRVVDSTGLFRTSVRDGGISISLPEPTNGDEALFELILYPPWLNPDLLSPLTQLILVTSSATTDDHAWYLCESRENCAVGTATLLAGPAPMTAPNQEVVLRDFGNIVLPVSKVVVQVREPNGDPLVLPSWVQVARVEACFEGSEQTCVNYFEGQQTRLGDGLVGFSLMPGVYELTALPPYSGKKGVTAGRMRIEVGQDGTVVAATVSGQTQARAGSLNEPLHLDLRLPNVMVTVRADGTPRPFTHVGVERWNGDWFEWSNLWASSNTEGIAGLRLEEGRWRLRAFPSGNDAESFSEARLEIEIGANEQVASVASEPYSGGPIYLDFQVPNVSGFVKTSSGTALSWAGMSFQRWNGQWFEGGIWTNSQSNGRYVVNLPQEMISTVYRVEIYPPTSVGIRTIRYIWVPAIGAQSPPCLTSFAAALADEPDCATGFDITLDGPNLEGRVIGLVSETPVPQAAWLYARKWNPDSFWFDWTDQWSDARSINGNFGFLLEEGFYEITAEPRPGTGFAKTSIYIQVSNSASSVAGDAYCLSSLKRPSGFDEPDFDDCRPANLVDGRLPLELLGANFQGAVTYNVSNSSGTGSLTGILRDGWVEIYDTTDGYQRWVASSGLNQAGAFALRLESVHPFSATRYQVVVTPSTWSKSISDLNLGKERFSIWVTTSAQNGTQVCWNDPDQSPCIVLSGVRSVVLGGGNVSGVVTAPDGSTVRDAQIQLEKWTENAYWMWTNEWSNTGQSGRYALSLAPNATYRVTFRPPWGRSDISLVSKIIHVTDDGFCVLEIPAVSCGSPPVFSSALNVMMGTPNLSAVVLGPNGPVRDVWVGVEQFDGYWWQWTNNAASSSPDGLVGLNIEVDGSYRVTVEAPWGGTGDLARFSIEFTVKDGEVSWPASVTIESGRALLEYPTANAVFTVVDPQGNTVRDAWVQVEERRDGQWRWTQIGGATRATGRVALILPGSTEGVQYRLTVNPPWNRSGLVRFSSVITVGFDAINQTLTYPTANLNGRILITGDAVGSSEVPNRWGWVQVLRANGEYLEGASANQDGRFSLFLANPEGESGTTTYRLVAYPNGSQLSARPMRLNVTVSGNTPVVTGCTYESSGESCLVGTQGGVSNIRAAFDSEPPNFTVKVISGGVPISGAFVRISGAGEVVDLVTDSNGEVKTNLPVGSNYEIQVLASKLGLTKSQSVPTTDTQTNVIVTLS